MKKYSTVSVIVDNPNSWFREYLKPLFSVIRRYAKHIYFVSDADQIKTGEILFILSCDRILTKQQLEKHKYNIVIHASDLPKGRGWSPLTWQVEAGKKRIPFTLFEADYICDSGGYYFKDYIHLDGDELVGQIRRMAAAKIIQMIDRFLAEYPNINPKPQKGKPTYYPKRKSEDCELRINETIKSQFNKMRVADNERYPLYFKLKGKKYILKIHAYNE